MSIGNTGSVRTVAAETLDRGPWFCHGQRVSLENAGVSRLPPWPPWQQLNHADVAALQAVAV